MVNPPEGMTITPAHDRVSPGAMSAEFIVKIDPQVVVEKLRELGYTVTEPGVDTDTHWANGERRLLRPEAYDRLTAERERG